MKTKIIIILLLFSIGVILFFGFQVEYPYKEGILYSQNQLKGYNEKEFINNNKNNLINRNEAIKIAKDILENVLDVDLKKGKPTMYVEIYKSTLIDETYDWNIWWSREDYSGNYGVELNSSTGEILNIYINEEMVSKNTEISSELTKGKILNIVKPLTDKLEINLNDYDVNINSIVDYNIKGKKTPYKECLFQSGKKKFRITIDSRAEKITNYTKKSL